MAPLAYRFRRPCDLLKDIDTSVICLQKIIELQVETAEVNKQDLYVELQIAACIHNQAEKQSLKHC